MKWTISILSLSFKIFFLISTFEMINPLCSIATFLLAKLYFFKRSNIEKLDLITTFFPFNCIFAIIKLFNIENFMNKIIILNGPNLNLLGEREKNQYGNFTLEDVEKKCAEYAIKNDIKLTMFQSNIEGELIEKIQASRNDYDGLIINAGGYTHTSVAIHDALKILKIPIIELHISNIYNREEFRHKSLISKVARGIICGFGASGYVMSLTAMKKFLKNEN